MCAAEEPLKLFSSLVERAFAEQGFAYSREVPAGAFWGRRPPLVALGACWAWPEAAAGGQKPAPRSGS